MHPDSPGKILIACGPFNPVPGLLHRPFDSYDAKMLALLHDKDLGGAETKDQAGPARFRSSLYFIIKVWLLERMEEEPFQGLARQALEGKLP